MRKEQSTNFENEQFLLSVCEINYTLNVISSRWSAQIIYWIYKGYNRFHLLKNELPQISDQVLGRKLKELEDNKVLIKKIIPKTVPMGIEYILTEKGDKLIPILKDMCKWAQQYEHY